MKRRNKIGIFMEGLSGVGGAERLMFEEARYLEAQNYKVTILTYILNPVTLSLLGNSYKPDIRVIPCRRYLPFRIMALDRELRKLKLDLLIVHEDVGTRFVYFASLFNKIPYVVHVPETIMWSIKGHLKHALAFRRVFHELRDSLPGHKEFIPLRMPEMSFYKRLWIELMALIVYLGVRRAKRIFVHTNMMKNDIEKLYRKGDVTVPIKGVFNEEILNYQPKQDIKARLGLTDKRIILNINRLDRKKRVDLAIKSFHKAASKFEDTVLVIGGVGPDEERLKGIVDELGLEGRVIFAGLIPEEELWDYYVACDVFVHPNRAEFAIAAHEPLALGKRVIWTSEMEVDKPLENCGLIYIADPNVESFSAAIERALSDGVCPALPQELLHNYTWDKYFRELMMQVEKSLS